MPFSVLLSVYKKEQPLFLRQSLDSIFNQTLLADEVILVEDGPLTPELYRVRDEYALTHPNLKVVALPVNQGLGKALNEGLKHCSFDLIARMDTDDVAKPNRFEKQVQIFETHPEIDIVSTWMDEFDGDTSRVISVKRVPETHAEITKFARLRNPINHPVVMFRKEAVLEAGSYRHFPMFEDYYLWVRMIMNGSQFYNIQESLLLFRCSKQMFERRGGRKYMINEIKFQHELKNIGFISFFGFVKNVVTRMMVRILPNRFRSFVYKNVIRK